MFGFSVAKRLNLLVDRPAGRSPTASRPSRLLVLGAWIGEIASLGGMVAMILIAIEKVRAGHGLDIYRTHWLVEDNWIGFLVFVAATAVALVIGLFARYKERREMRQLQAKYSGEHHE